MAFALNGGFSGTMALPTARDHGDPEAPPVSSQSAPRLLWSLVPVAALVAFVLPHAGVALGDSVSFMPAMLSLVACLDLISAVLLVSAFRSSGNRRALVLASSYVYSLVVLAGFSAAFPGILGAVGPLGGWPSTAPWLWAAWHTGFPLLLAAAVAPWPRAWTEPVSPGRRVPAAVAALAAAGVTGAVAVVTAVTGSGWLPVLIHGLDSSELTRLVAPVTLPIVALATVVAVCGAVRLAGSLRWAALACTAVLGDAVLTFVSLHRFSLGWYVGRSLTVISSAVLVVAILSEFSRLRRSLAVKAESLQALLSTSHELEALNLTLLNLMSDGVLLRGPDGAILATNPAAETLLGLSQDQVYGRAELPDDWGVVRLDGTPWPAHDLPALVTLRTGVAQRDQILGLPHVDGGRRWLRVSTEASGDPLTGEVAHVVSTMTDETDRHAAHMTERMAYATQRRRVQGVLDAGGPAIAVQPIVDLRSRAVIGGEALARFPYQPTQGPDQWFKDAAAVGLGTELELAAVRQALAVLRTLPAPQYLSINVSPATAISPTLLDMLAHADVSPDRVLLELTEHSTVTDYPALLAALVHIRALGVRLAIDDAGAGFASLSHILHLRPDVVKLDIGLVRNIHNDPARRALAAGLLIFANEIGASLVAEGIETEQEFMTLRQVGVTHGQGFYLGRPVPATQSRVLPEPRVPGQGGTGVAAHRGTADSHCP
jgi:EAL domain-containing protein (putative c-di-GMP-specific phosphodiesterase class I)/PAS domain-containing protein